MSGIPSSKGWARLSALIAAAVPYRLATLLEIDGARHIVKRRYTSDEVNYPSGGEKNLLGTVWAKRVIEDGQPFRASGPDEMRAGFGDHQLLGSLGLQQALNVPVWADGRVAWSLNLLRDQPPFSDEEVALVNAAISREDGAAER